ncbi:hypothetical protein GPALN_005906 [Globodera pallida]|uniref:Secreted protein n=1 Tax=Globodera pallida TaxID=36090 RepID=A0A183BZE8_GLOPA|nr:hypothetical protein GPALN_005906 [Globodera pallida]
MAVLRRFRSHFSVLFSVRHLAKSPNSSPPASQAVSMASSMLSSTTTTNSSSSSMPNTAQIGIERTSSKSQQKTPRFFFWTLSQGEKKKNCGTSLASSPRTPDSSRSVSFEGAENWPWIDDAVEECDSECECLVVV